MFNASFHRQGSVKQTKILQLIRERELRRREFEAQADDADDDFEETVAFEEGLDLDISIATSSALHSLYVDFSEAEAED